MNTLPHELFYVIFKNVTAETLQSLLCVNHSFRNVANTNYIWNKVYTNTIPDKFINWNKNDFRSLLKQHLSILRHTQWFKRQLFLQFINDMIIPNPFSQMKRKTLVDAFFHYSNEKFDTLPSSWYWEKIEDEHLDKSNKLVLLSNASNQVKIAHGSYIHWDFPINDQAIIEGFQLKNDISCCLK